MKLIALLLTLSLTPSTWAQGTNVGNGGGGGEPTFVHLRTLLTQWIELGVLSIDVSPSLVKVDWDELLETMKTVPVQFDPQKSLIVGSSKERACKNYPNPNPKLRRIECNSARWNEIPQNEQLAVVFHEYAGLLGYESNTGDFSNYPLSSQLIGILENTVAAKSFVFQFVDGESTRAIPNEILEFVRSQQTKRSDFTVFPNGAFTLNASVNFYNGTGMKGAFLKNGDYILNINPYKTLKGSIGRESFEIRQRGCSMFSVVMIWNPTSGIQSIQSQTQCIQGDLLKGFEDQSNEIRSDGSVTFKNKLVQMKKQTSPILIDLNGTKYQNSYKRRSQSWPN